MNVFPLTALEDNYIWVLENHGEIVVVDPGESKPVLDYLKETDADLKAILLTHKHEDHVGGVGDLINYAPGIKVYGPVETKTHAQQVVEDGDLIDIFDEQFKVYKTAGHTEEHVSYISNHSAFVGDALFSAGCGRVFTNDYQAQYEALQVFNNLDESINIYGGHEYTITNLNFALSVEPQNKRLTQALKTAEKDLENKGTTYPSTIKNEKEINLFLQAETLDEFRKLRDKRDNF